MVQFVLYEDQMSCEQCRHRCFSWMMDFWIWFLWSQFHPPPPLSWWCEWFHRSRSWSQHCTFFVHQTCPQLSSKNKISFINHLKYTSKLTPTVSSELVFCWNGVFWNMGVKLNTFGALWKELSKNLLWRLVCCWKSVSKGCLLEPNESKLPKNDLKTSKGSLKKWSCDVLLLNPCLCPFLFSPSTPYES